MGISFVGSAFRRKRGIAVDSLQSRPRDVRTGISAISDRTAASHHAAAVPALGRSFQVQSDNVSYHLDYHRGVRWELMEQTLLWASQRKVERLVQQFTGRQVTLSAPIEALPH